MAASPETTGKAGRVAVVDDETAARKRLGEAFGRDGYEVETFGDAEAFLARQGQAPFDAVLLDLRLPGMLFCCGR